MELFRGLLRDYVGLIRREMARAIDFADRGLVCEANSVIEDFPNLVQQADKLMALPTSSPRVENRWRDIAGSGEEIGDLPTEEEIQRLEALMTTWRDSEITRVNAAAGKDAVVVGPESFAVVDKSLWIAGLSEGVFDISFESMHGIWKFDQDLTPKVPSKAAIDEARGHVNWKNIQVDADAHTVKLTDPKMKISLGGIANEPPYIVIGPADECGAAWLGCGCM